MVREVNIQSTETSSSIRVVRALAWREFTGRYRDSLFGVSWTFIVPIVTLSIYGVIFSQVFSARWLKPDGRELNYALAIFSGFLIFNVIAEALNGSAYLIPRHAALVKRTRIKIEVIPVAFCLSIFYNFAVSSLPFFVLFLIVEGLPPPSILLLPIVILPLITLCAAMVFAVSSMAIFFPDLKQINALLTTAILFTSPIFFDASRLESGVAKHLSDLSPIGILIARSKELVFYGTLSDGSSLIIVQLFAFVLLVLSRNLFQKLAGAFADVL